MRNQARFAVSVLVLLPSIAFLPSSGDLQNQSHNPLAEIPGQAQIKGNAISSRACPKARSCSGMTEAGWKGMCLWNEQWAVHEASATKRLPRTSAAVPLLCAHLTQPPPTAASFFVILPANATYCPEYSSRKRV